MKNTMKSIIAIMLILAASISLVAQNNLQNQAESKPSVLVVKKYLKASPLSFFGILGIHHERFRNGKSTNYVFGYNETSEFSWRSVDGVEANERVESQHYFLIVERRFYGYERDAEGIYWAPFFETRLAPEDVKASSEDVDAPSPAVTDYSHDRNRWRFSLGCMGGYQIKVSKKFAIDVFGGVRGGYQFISSVNFDRSDNQHFSEYEELFRNKPLNRFRWGFRLGVTIGLLVGSAEYQVSP